MCGRSGEIRRLHGKSGGLGGQIQRKDQKGGRSNGEGTASRLVAPVLIGGG